jgi:hypothetical protein
VGLSPMGFLGVIDRVMLEESMGLIEQMLFVGTNLCVRGAFLLLFSRL